MDGNGGEGGEAFDTHGIGQPCGRQWSRGSSEENVVLREPLLSRKLTNFAQLRL